MRFLHSLFFFQGEDCIRGWSVTGVQTCALPICSPAHQRSPSHQPVPGGGEVVGRRDVSRSEERRVGKECRSRWSPYNKKKKKKKRKKKKKKRKKKKKKTKKKKKKKKK